MKLACFSDTRAPPPGGRPPCSGNRGLARGGRLLLELDRVAIGIGDDVIRFHELSFEHRQREWILDEPLASLDDDGATLARNLISEHLTNHGMAIIATHQEMGLSAGQMQRIEL